MRLPTLVETLRLDGIATLAGAAGLAAVAPWVTPAIGLTATWPIWVVAAGLAVYGIENLLAAKGRSSRFVGALIAADIVFALTVTALVITNPTGAENWVRWALFGVADLALLAAALKGYGVAREHRLPSRTAEHAPV